MRFCTTCGNMLYIKITVQGENSLVYYCRKCGNEEVNIDEDNICVSKTTFRKTKAKTSHMVNQYTKLDPTLPRVKNIKCPKLTCESNLKEDAVPTEILYMRYDDQNMKYMYICAVCDHIWKLDKN